MKADDKVSFDGEFKEDFTEFEYLKARLEQLEKVSDIHTDIFRSNNLELSCTTVAPYVDEDKIFEALAGN